MGGVARRATVLFETRMGKPVPSITVETGNELKQSDTLDEPMNRWVLEALNGLGVDFVNTTPGDLLRLNHLAQNGIAKGTELRPRFVATLSADGVKQPFPVKPYEIKTVKSSTGEEARVGVLALSPTSLTESQADLYEAALKKYLPEVERQSDVVILLSRLQDDDMFRIAAQFPGIDVIVNGTSSGEGREFPKAGNTVIVESARKGIALGLLEIEWDQKGHISKFNNQLVPLPPMIPDQPALAAIVEKAREEWGKAEEEQVKKSAPPPDTVSSFAGSAACKLCHEKAYAAWQKSGHARAFERLKGANQFDAECLRCHATAYGFKGGFVNMMWTPRLASVHCEACHGEAADHVRNPQRIHPGPKGLQEARREVGSQFCLRCHDMDNSPAFKFETYWPKIKH
jgi:2',3'-cyclic-nucleotide 2'-phosphodiesterase (5'-nucleotidase family)